MDTKQHLARLMEQSNSIEALDNCSTATVLEDIAFSGEQEDPFYVCDVADIVRKHVQWMQLMPRVKPFYAVKCNSSPAVLQTLAALGVGFDCASMAEIEQVLSVGVSPSNVIFSNTTKAAGHLRHARIKGVELMTFDNEAELKKVHSIFPTAKLLLRLRCAPTDCRVVFSHKFGCSPQEAPLLLRAARALGLRVVGVSFHLGSDSRSPLAYESGIEAARQVFEEGRRQGWRMRVLDIGGGFPGDEGTSLHQFAQAVNSGLAQHFPDQDVLIIAEPGRYFVASAFTLAAQIHSLRDATAETSAMYYLNDGLHGSFNRPSYKSIEPRPLRKSCGPLLPCSLWGPTCDPTDQILQQVELPKMDVGDWLVFPNFGAYSVSLAGTFNGFPLPRVYSFADTSTSAMITHKLQMLKAENTDITSSITKHDGNAGQRVHDRK